MSFLFTSRTVHVSKTIAASKEKVLEFIQEPEKVLHINPLIYSFVQDTQDPSWYTIKEKLPVLGGLIESSTTFRCKWEKAEQGNNIDVEAGLGTKLRNEMRVSENSDKAGSCVLAEKVVVTGFFLLMPYIESTMTSAHIYVLDLIADSVATVISAVILLLSLFLVTRSSDPYGLFHLTLNRLPSQDPNQPPDTEWLNMGYWKEGRSFPEACKALAMKMIGAANLKKGGRVLDVGHGTGESLLLLLSETCIERPAELVGITTLKLHHERSLERVKKCQAQVKSDTAVELYHGDAVYDGNDTSHPLSSTTKPFDTILALDCAYHFNTRHRFLEQSYNKLSVGGSLALADICFSPVVHHRRIRCLTRWTLRGLMPSHNMVSAEEYIAQMRQIGFKEVVLEDVSSDVFPGFIRFLKGMGGGWLIFSWIITWYASDYVGARFVVVSGRK